jgi:CubicO group peptidase (beta-lactamase class C family)
MKKKVIRNRKFASQWLLVSVLFLSAVILYLFSCQTPESITRSRIKSLEKGLYRAVYFKGQRPEKLRLLDRMAFYKVPGLTLAVMDRFQIEWVKTYGYKDIVQYRKLTPETAFQAGDLSQPVSATVAVQLVEEKRLDLNEQLGVYFVETAFAGRKFKPSVSILMDLASLLNHTSGFYPWNSSGYSRTSAIPDLAQVLRGEEPAQNYNSFRGFDPEAGTRFSDFNYVLLEKYLEDRTGRKLAELAKEKIFERLALNNTFFGLPVSEDIASGHMREGPEVDGIWYKYPEQAARGLWSTPSDYLRFVVELVECARGKKDGLVSPELARQMLSPQAPGSGYGFRLEGEHEKFKIYMKGKTRGYRSALLIYPYLSQGVVVMTNSENGGVLIDEVLRGLSAIYDWPDFKPEEKTLFRLDSSIYKQYCGCYQVNDSYFLDVSYENYYLIVHPTGQSPTKFYVETQSIFFSVDPFIRIKFNFDENNQVTGLVLWQEDYEVRAKKIS